MKNFKKLLVWQKGLDIVIEVYRITVNFPKDEKYRLSDQMCRAAISIPSNIAEGSGRKSEKEYVRFLEISLGSLFELETQLIISARLKILDDDTFNNLLGLISEEQKLLNGLIDAISRT